jgi:DNA processing protein
VGGVIVHGEDADPQCPPEVPEEVLLARAYLSRVAEPATYALWRFVDDVGPIAAAEAVRAGSAPAPVMSACAARRAECDPLADLDAADRHGIRLVVPESAQWPHLAMGALHRRAVVEVRARVGAPSADGALVPPLALWVRGTGDLAALGLRSVAIVGARAATAYGQRVATTLGYDLARAGLDVISGGAFGIDAAAHRAALAAGGVTVVVSAGGVDLPYPRAHARLFEQAADGGLVLGESPPGAAPQRHRFLTRNRIIAALSRGVVVVEAAHRSGAANTAAHAVALGRMLMAVPGPVTSAMSAGCHDLIRSESMRAVLISDADHVLELIGPPGAGGRSDVASTPAPRAGLATDRRPELDVLPEVERRVFDGVPARRAVGPEEIALRCGVDIAGVIRALPGLRLAGLVEEAEGRFRVARQRGP